MQRDSGVEGPINVAIVDDDAEVRNGLKLLLNGTPGFCCTEVYADMASALARIGSNLPHVVLLDIGLPGMSGIEGARLLRDRYPKIDIVLLSIYDDEARIFQGLCAGACGYLLKNTAPERILESLREVVNGGAPMSPEVARQVLTVFRKFQPVEKSTYGLTPHELRILKLLAEGYNFKRIATQFGVSMNTVSFHARNIYSKLQVHSKSEAVAKALRSGCLG